MKDVWKRRRHYKMFTNAEVPKALEEKLDRVIEYCPVQRHSQGFVHFFKCTAKDLIVKEQLSRYVFKNNNQKVNEIAPITASLVYFCAVEADTHFRDSIYAGLVGGALMAETINAGYNFSFIGCTEDTSPAQLDIINKTLQNRYDVTKRYSAPFLAFCIGKGKNAKTEGNNTKIYTLHDGQKIKFSNSKNQDLLPKRLFL